MTRDEADNRLRQAILDHALAYELTEADELLSDYAVVAHWQAVVDDGSSRSRYTTQFARSPTPSHVAAGLLRVGAHLVECGEE